MRSAVRNLTILILYLLVQPSAWAESQWTIDFSTAQNTLSVNYKDRQFSVLVPRSVSKISADDNTLYFWQGSKKELTMLTKYELGAPSEGRTAIVPYGAISFSKELGDLDIIDFAVLQNGASSSVFFSAPTGKPGKIWVKPFGFLKRREAEEKDLNADGRPDLAPLSRDDRVRTGLVSFTGDPVEILGSGSITMLRDPETGGMLLLSYDSAAQLIHEYGVTNPYAPIYLRSYAIPEGLRTNSQAPLTEFNIDTIGAPTSHFILRHPNFAPIRLSLLKLREVYAIQRTYLLNNWTSEVIGNVWTKQLLGWGALSSTVDALDRVFSNPNANLDLIKNDGAVSTILAQKTPAQVLEFAKESGLFTDKEIAQMRLEMDLKESRGRKSFLTAGLVVGLLSYINVKDSLTLRNQLTHITSNIWAFAEKALYATGRTPEQLARFRNWGVHMQMRFRGHLVKSAQIQRHPSHLLKTLEKNLEKARAQLAKSNSSLTVEIEPAKAMDGRVRQIMEQWKALLTPAEQGKKYAKLYESISADVKKLEILEEQIHLNAKLTAIKTRILLTKAEAEAYKKGAKVPSIRDLTNKDENMSFLKATDADLLRSEAAAATKALDDIEAYLMKGAANDAEKAKLLRMRASLKAKRASEFSTELNALMARNNEINTVISSWTTHGKVHPFFDHWARASSLWAQYFLPTKVMKGMGLESNFAHRYLRNDYIATASGNVEKVVISGEHAKLAVVSGSFDVAGDVLTQWLARAGAEDPNERMWGTGDNHYGLVPVNGKLYGPHFDLLATELVNAWGWALSMPLSYARMDMSYGSKGSISYMRRLWDSQLKSLPNMPYNMLNEYPFWFLSAKTISWDYERKHKNEGSFNEEAYAKFKEKLASRTTSTSSQFERVMFGKFVGVPYINPQYNMQAEFNKVSDLIFRTPWVKQIVGGILMPITTGYGYGKWWGDYFGFNNPATIEVMRQLEIDGILKKVDDQGYTNLNEWTEHELTMFFFMISLFEMERYNQQNPMPTSGKAEDLAAWYNDVYKNLFTTDSPDIKTIQSNLGKLRVVQPQVLGKSSTEKDTRWAKQAANFSNILKNMKTGIARLPFVAASKNQDALLIKVQNIQNDSISISQLKALEQDAVQINSALSDAIRLMQSNKETYAKVQSNAFALSLINTIVLGDQFFANGKLLGLPAQLIGKWNATSQRILSRLAFGGVIASIPYYFWLDDQAEAHLREATNNGLLLKDLQSLLLSATEALAVQYVQLSLQGENLLSLNENITELKQVMEKSKVELESYLLSTQEESRELLTNRRYRWAKVYSEYSIYGMGGMAAWMAARYTLFRGSQGLVLKMTDPFAPLLFKASALSWLYFGQDYRSQKGRIALTTQDFFILYQSYISTLLRLELLKQAEIAVKEKRALPLDINQQMAQFLANDKVVKQMEDYRQAMLKLANE